VEFFNQRRVTYGHRCSESDRYSGGFPDCDPDPHGNPDSPDTAGLLHSRSDRYYF